MDIGLLFGIIGTWVLVCWSIMSGGSIWSYYDFASVILVVGGTCTLVFFCYPARNVGRFFAVFRTALFHKSQSNEKLIEDLVSYAEMARRDGILSLEGITKDIDDRFIVRGIQMAVDGTDPELIETIMNAELDSLVERHDVGKALFDGIGKYAPAMGMIGTLVGLVIMLKNLDDPKKIGPGMAVAILTTLYGALIANAFALPLSDRLSKRSAEEVLRKTIIVKAVMAIQSGDNPRIVEQKLRTFLPPAARKQESDEEQKAA